MNNRDIPSQPPLPTNRKFGLFFAAMFAGLAAYLFWKVWDTFAQTALVIALLFAALTLVSPQILAPLNRLWHRIGMLLGRIVNPIVLGTIFFLLITPVSLATRIFGRDELRLKKRNVDSYWIDRSPSGPPQDSFKNQY